MLRTTLFHDVYVTTWNWGGTKCGGLSGNLCFPDNIILTMGKYSLSRPGRQRGGGKEKQIENKNNGTIKEKDVGWRHILSIRTKSKEIN